MATESKLEPDESLASLAYIDAAARVMWDEAGYLGVENVGVSPLDSLERAGEHKRQAVPAYAGGKDDDSV